MKKELRLALILAISTFAASANSQTAAKVDNASVASITPEQQARISQALKKNVADKRIRLMVADAAPSITPFIERLSCIADYPGTSSLNVYAAPGVDLAGPYVMLRPMRATQHHNKSSCLTVTRIHGWSAPAANALKFEVVYVADDSGESAKTKHEVVKQPDGTWLFTAELY